MEEKLIETEEMQERAAIIAAGDYDGIEESLGELSSLADTAGVLVVGKIIQKRDKPHPRHYIGIGKLEELKELVSETGADLVIADDELSPSQMGNLAEELNIKVLDRSLLILEIFAKHAKTAEGAIQTELARLKYDLSHLSGLGKSFSRQGGGGAGGGGARRGLGETKLELDRRVIRERIAALSDQIDDIKKRRGAARAARQKNQTPVIAICGYTNSGKSTLLNTLTDAGILAEDKLFATLDTTVRRLRLPSGAECVLADTVGFIRKLPHALIQAFSSTLEEVKPADVLLHVVDASEPDIEARMEVVTRALAGLSASAPVIVVFNKIDKLEDIRRLPLCKDARARVEISAINGAGLDALLFCVEEVLKSGKRRVNALVPYGSVGVLMAVRGRCDIISEEYVENGIMVEAFGDEAALARLEPFVVVEAK